LKEKRRLQQNDPDVINRHRDVSERLRNNYSSRSINNTSSNNTSIENSSSKLTSKLSKFIGNVNNSTKGYTDIEPYSDNDPNDDKNQRLINNFSNVNNRDFYETTSQSNSK
jgi:hypothetical protein